ncbi:MAG: DUF11 domain-containing protein [bacterium]|nr:DUF11 domain-containing protein [bacterium]
MKQDQSISLTGQSGFALASIALILAATMPVSAAVIFDGSPGTNAPPATLGGYTMTPFPFDPRPFHMSVTTVPTPGGADIAFAPAMRMGTGWPTPHGYDGATYWSDFNDTVTITLFPNTVAFYFYVRPNHVDPHDVTATTTNGASSGPVSVVRDDGAKYFGFYATAGSLIGAITVDADPDASGFNLGEFGICTEGGLRIAKTAPADVVVGGQAIYDITVTNDSPVVATNVVVTDTLPGDLEYVTDTAEGTLSAGTGPGGEDQLVCPLDDIAPGASIGFQVKMSIPANLVSLTADGTATALNTADVTSDHAEDIIEDNTATAGFFVSDSADLTITKMSKPDDTVLAGEAFEYTLIVENVGPSYARGVYIRDDMLSSGAFTVVGIVDDPLRNDACTLSPATPPQTGQIIRCELVEPLEPVGTPGGTGRWVIQVIVQALETQDVNNVARVYTGPNDNVALAVPWTNGTPDPDTSNNQAIDFISVVDTSDLSLVKTDDVDPINAGEELTYTLTVTNNGPSTATDVVIEDKLPADVEVLEVTGAGPQPGVKVVAVGTPGDPLDPTTCYLGALALGESGAMTVTVRVSPDIRVDAITGEAVIFNDAWAYSSSLDPDTSNNHASEPTTVLAEADIEVSQAALANPVAAGDSVVLRVNFANNGPGLATLAVLAVEMPDEVVPVNAYIVFGDVPGAKAIGDCIILPGEIVCELGDLPRGSMGTVLIEAMVPEDTGDALVDIAATIASGTPDPNNANNTSTVPLTIVACSVPAAPTNVKATKGIHIHTIVVTWDAMADATGYEIYRSTGDDFAAADLLGTLVGTEYLDYEPNESMPQAGCSGSQTFVFNYWIVAVNDCGSSPPSDPDDGYQAPLKSAGVDDLGQLALFLAFLTVVGISSRWKRLRGASER